MTIIQTYTSTLLASRLKSYGLNKAQRAVICSDVAQRLSSLLSRWADEPFRRTVLLLGEEEATFWEPRTAPLEIRALVVVCVRNSLVEGLNASTRAKRQVLPDAEMPLLTSEAIEHFRKADLSDISITPGPDIFGALPRKIPNAWQALSTLACIDSGETDYVLTKQKAEALELGAAGSRPRGAFVSQSGIDSSIDADLAQVLRMIQKGEMQVFYSPSFSRITRNPGKLLAILDHVLRHNGSLVTENFALCDNYVARRQSLIRPAHDMAELERNRGNFEGLRPKHQALIELL